MIEYVPYLIALYLFIGFVLGSLFTYFDDIRSAGPLGIVVGTFFWLPMLVIGGPLFVLFWWSDKLEEWGQAHRIARSERKWRKANEHR